MMAPAAPVGPYREPGTPARLFVYGFAWLSPVLTLGIGIVPAGTYVGAGAIAASFAGVAYVSVLLLGVRAARRLGGRFTPPLALPGDIWNIGVPEPPRRSSNWPIRLFRRPPGGTRLRRAA